MNAPTENDVQKVSDFSILTNLFTAPSKAYESLKQSYSIAFPMISILLLNAILIVSLYSVIDFNWFVDHMVETQAGELTKAEQDQTRQAFEMMSANAMGGIGAVSVAIVLAIVFSLQALYFVIVSNITNDGYQFKQWLSFSVWSSIPSLLGTLASFVVVFTTTNGQIAPETLNPLSLNELFFGLDATKGMGALLASTDITMFISFALMTIGYANWTKKSIPVSLITVLVPYILFFSIRLAFV